MQRETVRRIVMSLVAAEIERMRGPGAVPVSRIEPDWDDDGRVGSGGLELDSLESAYAAAALNEMFHLDESGWGGSPQPDTIGGWLDRIDEAQQCPSARITVMTSGSTGVPKPCIHSLDELHVEAAHFAGLIGGCRRIIALVPAHHIYGLIWTAMLPARLGVPVLAATTATLPIDIGDLIVAVPDQWRALLRLRKEWPTGVSGISAGAPLDDGLAHNLLAAGIDCLYDIYGSSETGGVATRRVPNTGYELLPRWEFAALVSLNSPSLTTNGREIPLPDRISQCGPRSFTLEGRRDAAVQVTGINVWPEKTTAVLLDCPQVAEAVVRLGGNGRLKAFIVPAGSQDETIMRHQLDQIAKRLLSFEQRPASYSFGIALPCNLLGKLVDWL